MDSTTTHSLSLDLLYLAGVARQGAVQNDYDSVTRCTYVAALPTRRRPIIGIRQLHALQVGESPHFHPGRARFVSVPFFPTAQLHRLAHGGCTVPSPAYVAASDTAVVYGTSVPWAVVAVVRGNAVVGRQTQLLLCCSHGTQSHRTNEHETTAAPSFRAGDALKGRGAGRGRSNTATHPPGRLLRHSRNKKRK